MFEFAFIIGIYSYLIFLLGVFGVLYKNLVIFSTIVYFFIAVVFFLRKHRVKLNFGKIKIDKTSKILLIVLGFQIVVNLIGVLGPEISFDALWYHLTLPKLYLASHAIFHIPGGLFYYSDMPKLVEMFYVGMLSFGSETLAKLIHFSFGLLSLIAIYKISQRLITEKYSIIAALIFYSSMMVGWESITAYVDLSRTFFELMAVWGFLNWTENKSLKWIIISGLMLGFAIAVKLVAAQSLVIFLCLFIFDAYLKKTKIVTLLKNYLIFALSAVIVPLPWLIFSFVNTGNLFYPYFSKISVDSGQTFLIPNFLFILKDFYNFFLNLNDPISPLYLILLPLILISLKNSEFRMKLLAIYTFLAVLIWYLTQEVRGGRFILPYLPVFSILAAYSIYKLRSKGFQMFLVIVVIVVSLSSTSYRLLANSKYIPVIFGEQTRSQFLTKNLNFSFGDFYDTDSYFHIHIKKSDTVLLYGFHNLYYVDFPFIDSSFVKKGKKFNYIATQNSKIPVRFSDWKQIYYNSLTMVRLYSKGDKTWAY